MLKKFAHNLRVKLMLKKRISLFGNRIHTIVGAIKEYGKYPFIKGALKPGKIAIFVLNRNNNKVIFRCLDSLIKFNSYNYEIIVVDNKSTDGSYEKIKKYKNIKLLRNKINGCSSGRNLGVKKTKADYVLFLDSDQWPTQNNWLDSFIYILQNIPEIGAVGSAGGFFTEKDISGPTFDFYKNSALPEKYLFRTNIDYLATCGFLIKKSVFEKVGMFDEKYDPYCFEDADLSRKIIASGKKIAYSRAFPVFHVGKSTTRAEGEKEYLKQFTKNALYFRKKWLEK